MYRPLYNNYCLTELAKKNSEDKSLAVYSYSFTTTKSLIRQVRTYIDSMINVRSPVTLCCPVSRAA